MEGPYIVYAKTDAENRITDNFAAGRLTDEEYEELIGEVS